MRTLKKLRHDYDVVIRVSTRRKFPRRKRKVVEIYPSAIGDPYTQIQQFLEKLEMDPEKVQPVERGEKHEIELPPNVDTKSCLKELEFLIRQAPEFNQCSEPIPLYEFLFELGSQSFRSQFDIFQQGSNILQETSSLVALRVKISDWDSIEEFDSLSQGFITSILDGRDFILIGRFLVPQNVISHFS